MCATDARKIGAAGETGETARRTFSFHLGRSRLDMQPKGCIIRSWTRTWTARSRRWPTRADVGCSDVLRADNGQTLGRLCEHLDMTRQAVSKHLAVLEEANLVVTLRRGREKLHYLNPVPIHEIAERWIAQVRAPAAAGARRTQETDWKEKPMADSRFVYVTYIRTTPEKLWQALIDPEFTRRYWVETWQECEWKAGASWRLMIPDGRVADSGEILEIDPPRRLVLSWRNEFKPELREEGHSRLTYELEQQGESVKLTVLHEMDKPDSKLIKSGVERLAAYPGEPQESPRNRRTARRNPPLDQGRLQVAHKIGVSSS